jgi:hypothetical protein
MAAPAEGAGAALHQHTPHDQQRGGGGGGGALGGEGGEGGRG